MLPRRDLVSFGEPQSTPEHQLNLPSAGTSTRVDQSNTLHTEIRMSARSEISVWDGNVWHFLRPSLREGRPPLTTSVMRATCPSYSPETL